MAVGFLSSNSKVSVGVTGIMMVEIVFLLKYIDLNYPQNLREYFFERSHFLENNKVFSFISFEKNEAEFNNLPFLYRYYRASPYFFDMGGEMIFKCMFFLVLGYALWGLHHYCFSIRNLNKNKNIIKKLLSWLLQKLYEWLVWEYIIMLFLMNYQQLFFWMLVSFFFPPLKSPSGIINFLSALFYCFINFIVLAYFGILIHKKSLENIRIKHYDSPNHRKNIEILKYFQWKVLMK